MLLEAVLVLEKPVTLGAVVVHLVVMFRVAFTSNVFQP